MDLFDSLTTDYDELRYMALDCQNSGSNQREQTLQAFKQLARLQYKVAHAERAALSDWTCKMPHVCKLIRDFAEGAQCMEDFAQTILETADLKFRDAKIELYCALVLRRITDASKLLLPTLLDQMSEDATQQALLNYERYKDTKVANSTWNSHPHVTYLPKKKSNSSPMRQVSSFRSN